MIQFFASPKLLTTILVSMVLSTSSLFAFDINNYHPSGAIPIIFDTDMGPDIDDVGALAVLHAFADVGVCRIIAVGVDSPEPYSACCADAINTYYQRPDIPIGLVKNSPGVRTDQVYAKPITEQFPNDLKNTMSNIPDAVAVYRRALVQEADSSVVFVATGFKTILSQLLKSSADTISPLSGIDLVKKKGKLWVDMGGQYPSGQEFNFYWDAGSASYVVANWPTPAVFTGWEIGNPIISGSTLSNKAPANSPIRKAYEIFLGVGNGRSSWDLTASLFACSGLKNYWNAHSTGHNTCDNGGNNQWVEQNVPGVSQSYLVAKMASDSLGAVLDSIIVLPPHSATEIKHSSSAMKINSTLRPEIILSQMSKARITGSLYDVKGQRINTNRVSRQALMIRARSD